MAAWMGHTDRILLHSLCSHYSPSTGAANKGSFSVGPVLSQSWLYCNCWDLPSAWNNFLKPLFSFCTGCKLSKFCIGARTLAYENAERPPQSRC